MHYDKCEVSYDHVKLLEYYVNDDENKLNDYFFYFSVSIYYNSQGYRTINLGKYSIYYRYFIDYFTDCSIDNTTKYLKKYNIDIHQIKIAIYFKLKKYNKHLYYLKKYNSKYFNHYIMNDIDYDKNKYYIYLKEFKRYINLEKYKNVKKYIIYYILKN